MVAAGNGTRVSPDSAVEWACHVMGGAPGRRYRMTLGRDCRSRSRNDSRDWLCRVSDAQAVEDPAARSFLADGGVPMVHGCNHLIQW
jgi:hypothetical protein